MPIPTGPYPNNRPRQGGSNPDKGLPLPPVIPTGATPVSQTPLPPLPDEDETFSQVPMDEVGYDDEPEEEILPQRSRPRPVRRRTIVEEPAEIEEDDSIGDEEFAMGDSEDEEDDAEVQSPILDLKKDRKTKGRDKKERTKPQRERGKSRGKRDKEIKPGYTDDTFIDEENKTLKPFGRVDRKRNAKVGEFDNRKNMRNQQKMVQTLFVALAAIAVALGLFRVFVPPKTLKEDEVLSLISQSTGKNGFPQQEGGAFATEFMKAYLSNDDSPINQRVLSYYYTGKMDGTTGEEANQAPQGNFTQRVVYGPMLYTSLPVSSNSGSYVIGALVEPSSSQGKAPSDGSAVKWMFFNVNVYYDKASNSFSIPKGSPTIVPATAAGSSITAPAPKSISSSQSDDDLNQSVRSVVIGFVKGYASSSNADHTALDQYITSTTDPKLTQGLDNQYTLSGDEDSAITTTAYPTADPSVVKVQVEVQWMSRAVGGGNASNVYTSDYIATLTKQSNGKYLVSKFAPEYYFPSTTSSSSASSSSTPTS